MGTPHNDAEVGQIAPYVLMPGDPKRAAKIAADFLTDATLVSDVRGIPCYTGLYHGEPMSVMASGMGLPSISIYATELYRFYGVKRIARVGTCGAYLDEVHVQDVVIISAAHTDSDVPNRLAPGMTCSLAPDPQMLRAAMNQADALTGARVHVGPCLSSDYFYRDNASIAPRMIELRTMAVEMESAGLYACALEEGAAALAVVTVSDHLRHAESLSAAQREDCYRAMVDIAGAALLA